jgi:DUF4097 and DUF4098 domain-containing protein YvlB
MRSKVFIYSAASVLLIAANAFAAKLSSTDRFSKELPLEIGGTLWVDNPVGNIEITGTENPGLIVVVSRTITGDDRTALAEGREQTVISFEGARNTRFVRTIYPQTPVGRWNSSVTYSIRVPRTVHIRVAAKLAERIRVANIGGNVTVKSFAGAITLDGVTGASIIDTTNGKVSYIYHQRPAAHAQIQAVSADIDVTVPPDSSFNWVADTLRGDVLTNLPVRAQFLGSAIHGTVNAAGGPTITMQTLLGTIRLLGGGVKQVVRSLRQNTVATEPTARMEMKSLMMRPAKRIQLPIAGGGFDFAAGVADVEVGEVRGNARVQTVAGEIKLGLVMGDCTVISQGGPLDLGDILGTLLASTEAGDVIVRSVRDGGRVFTAGGLIRVLYSGGAITLQSGGGDIIMRQAAGPVSAETHSGDINITADPNQKTPRIEARTAQGNIAINMSPKFGADIDAVILTSDPDSNSIHSDFAGLQIKSDQVGSKTRIHATGKVNGGGERVELYAEEGDIHISNLTASPVSIMPPLQ